jgi:signal transduction histidine kinase
VVDRTAELLEATASNASLEQEIRERKRVERELRSAKDQAEVANRSKSEFLAMVSHELRTPLNAVIGFSEMLILETFGPVGDKRYAEYSEDIRNSGLHLLSLINNILDLSKVEANQFQLVDQNVDIAELISEAHLYVRDRADAVGIKIKTDVPKSLPQIYGDDRALKQILINLLSNAVKFTGRGGKVSLSAKLVSDGRLVLTVSDTGIGIAEADFKAIFQPFTQVDSSLSRQYEGTGLGLPLTKSLVELHGGELKLQSKSGVGTTVQVFLPKKRVLNQRNAAA